MNWEFSKIIVSRNCNLLFRELEQLKCNDTFDAFVVLDNIKKLRLETAEALVDILFKLASDQDDKTRNMIIKLKRAVFNDKMPKDEDASLLETLNNPNLNTMFDSWRNLFKKEEDLRNQLEEVHSRSLGAARLKIAELCHFEEFQKGVQFSGQRFFKKMKQYSEAVVNGLEINKPLRQTEEGLISFLYRMALKPSPFGSFTDIKMHLDSVKHPNANNSKRFSLCNPSRLLMQWLSYQCQKLPQLVDELPIRMNQTIKLDSGQLSFFSRPDDGTADMFGKEKFIKLKNSNIFQEIETLLSSEPLNKKTLIVQLMNSHGNKNQLDDYVEKLIKIGLLQRTMNIPDQTIRYSKAVSEYLSQFEDGQITEISNTFKEMHEIEIALQVADAHQREVLIKKFEDCFLKVVAMTNSENPGLNAARSLFYEDVGQVVFNFAEEQEKFSKSKMDLALLCKIIPLLEDSTIERFSLYKFFKRLYKQDERVDFLDFYKTFSSMGVEEITQIMTGKACDEVKKIRDLRKKWYENLDDMVRNNNGKSVAEMDAEWIAAFINTIPDYVGVWSSAAFYLQHSPLETNDEYILNGASMGHGAMLSRFASIFTGDDSQRTVVNTIYEDIYHHESHDDIADIASVLGINTNLHPHILNSAIEYPGSIADKKSYDKIYTLNDICIVPDDIQCRLKLTCKTTQKIISFLPLNFLYPTVGPSLYRFLYLFCPYGNFKGGIWRRYLSQFPQEANFCLPRLKLGSIVLSRRMWVFDAEEVLEVSKNKADFLKILEDVEKWRKHYGLPISGFYSQTLMDNKFDNWVSAVSSSIRDVNKIKARKPHFLDFRNPFLIKIFLKHLTESNNAKIIFQECLPDEKLYLENSDLPAAREHLVQINRVRSVRL